MVMVVVHSGRDSDAGDNADGCDGIDGAEDVLVVILRCQSFYAVHAIHLRTKNLRYIVRQHSELPFLCLL